MCDITLWLLLACALLAVLMLASPVLLPALIPLKTVPGLASVGHALVPLDLSGLALRQS